ncbi:MAG TPA: response regulator transcription factor [Vicinamibacterales bacterium]|nr:response regulator transcription factor [Vicinamibacterales bacterium]
MAKIRVLLAEDHETVRHGLKLLINGQTDMEVVGEAGDGRVAVERAKTLQPNVAVVDVSMPQMNGLAATKAIRESTPGTAVVALTRYDDEAYVQELLNAGALGYVLKQSPSAELVDAVRAAASGRRYLDRRLAARVAGDILSSRRRRAAPPAITDREREVLRLMALGHSNKEIAELLFLSVKTIEVHKANAMRKLGLAGRTDVVRYALLQGWLRDPQEP